MMKKTHPYYYPIRLLLLLCVSFNSLSAQNIGTLKNQKAFDLSGNLYLSGNVYTHFGDSPTRRSPWSYAIGGTPVISIYGFKLPFSFSFQNQKFSYSRPFNRFGLSPTYKWVKLHAGYRSMSFSPYTLSGQTFLGGGVELTPGKFRFSALYGSFINLSAQIDTAILGTQLIDTYKRKVHGAKIGYGGQKASIDLTYLKTKDDLASASVLFADNKILFPEDNFVLGLDANIRFFKKLNLSIKTAASLHTADQRLDIEIDDEATQKVIDKAEKFIHVNASTRWGFAGDIGLDLNLKKAGFGITYKRIEPHFRSLGMYYLRTDFENYTANMRLKFLDQRLLLRFKGGFQKDNLSKLKMATSVRKIAAVLLNYVGRQGFNFNGNYNNYQTDQQAGYIEVQDSLKLALVNQSASITTGYSWKKDKIKKNISLSLSRQTFRDVNDLRELSLVDNTNTTSSLSYRISYKPRHLSFRMGVNYYTFQSQNGTNVRLGGNIGIGKQLLDEKINLKLRSSWNKSLQDQQDDGYVLRLSTRISYKLTDEQRLSFYALWLNKATVFNRAINESRAGMRYVLSF